jgi:hypothetical protein
MSLKKIALVAALPILFAAPALAHQTIKPAAQSAGNTVTAKSVTIAKDGFLVIHAMKDGKPVVPASLGHVALKAGTTRNVVIELSEATSAGDTVLFMLHTDDGTMGGYDFPNGDAPVVVGGKPVVKPAKIN